MDCACVENVAFLGSQVEYRLEYGLVSVTRSSLQFAAAVNRSSCSTFSACRRVAQQFRTDF